MYIQGSFKSSCLSPPNIFYLHTPPLPHKLVPSILHSSSSFYYLFSLCFHDVPPPPPPCVAVSRDGGAVRPLAEASEGILCASQTVCGDRTAVQGSGVLPQCECMASSRCNAEEMIVDESDSRTWFKDKDGSLLIVSLPMVLLTIAYIPSDLVKS